MILLGISANIVDLTKPAAFHHGAQSGAMVFHIQPITCLLAIPVNGRLCFKRSLFNFANKSKIDIYNLIPDAVFLVTLLDFDTVNETVYKVLV